jgi:arylsulfatase A-like enzyme
MSDTSNMSNKKQPNIIFLFTDQQRADTCGCYGQPLEVTPNLDQMAKEGILFQNTFTCQPVCGPMRACLQTGTFATQSGCYRNGIKLPHSDKNIANYYSKAGYEVGYIGKWHLASTVGKSKENIGELVDYE